MVGVVAHVRLHVERNLSHLQPTRLSLGDTLTYNHSSQHAKTGVFVEGDPYSFDTCGFHAEPPYLAGNDVS